jgi:hypothetical protein
MVNGCEDEGVGGYPVNYSDRSLMHNNDKVNNEAVRRCSNRGDGVNLLTKN